MADEKVPETLDDARTEIVVALKHRLADCAALIGANICAPLVMRWLSAARGAELRMRPVSEMPEEGDWIVMVGKTGDWRTRLQGLIWCDAARGRISQHNEDGWYLLRRAPKPPSLREMAEKLEAMPEWPRTMSEPEFLATLREWARAADTLRRAVLDQEPQA